MNEETEKKEYEEPTVQKVEFDFREVITSSPCRVCKDEGAADLTYIETYFQ